MKTTSTVAILFLMLSSAVLGATSGGLSFIHDDYPNAVKEAKQRHLPVFVDVWAPW